MNLLSPSIIASFTGEAQNHFDTFCSVAGPIIVNKEPIRTISAVNYPNFGYSQPLNADTYTPVYRQISGYAIYPKEQDQKMFSEGRLNIPQGDVTIKVDVNGKNFIESGRTESIQVDGVTYNNISDFRIQNYYGLKFYYYDLRRIE